MAQSEVREPAIRQALKVAILARIAASQFYGHPDPH